MVSLDSLIDSTTGGGLYEDELSTARFFPTDDSTDTTAYAPWSTDSVVPLRRSTWTLLMVTGDDTVTIPIDSAGRAGVTSVYLNAMTECVGVRLRDSLGVAVTLFLTDTSNRQVSLTDSLLAGRDIRNGMIWKWLNDTCRAYNTGDSQNTTPPTSPRTRQVAHRVEPDSVPDEYFSDLIRVDVPSALRSATLDSVRLITRRLDVYNGYWGLDGFGPGTLRVPAITLRGRW